MTDIFRPKTINVPGLLSDSALQEQLKQLAGEMNTQQAAAPMPSSAVEMADKIQNQFLNIPKQVLVKAAPMAAGPLAPLAQAAVSAGTRPAPAPQDPALTAQDEAIDVRSDILSAGVDAVTPNFLTDIGTLSPEERQAEADQRAKDAASTEGAMLDKAEVRAKLREQAATDKSGLSFMEGVEATDTNQLAENAAQDRRVTDNVQKKTDIAKKAVTDKELQPTQTWWMNMVQRGIAKVPTALTDAASGAIIAGYEAPRDFFFGGDLGRSDMRAWVQTVDATINKILPGDKARSQDFLTQLAEGGGSMVSYMMGGYIARAIGMPAAAPTAVLGGLGGGANQFEDAERFNASGLQKYMSFVMGAGLGITDAIPIDRMFMSMDLASGGLIMKMLNQTKVGSLTEFIQETGQTFGEDVVARLLYDAKREFDPAKYLKAGLVGGITGGLAGATTAILDASPATNPALKVNPKLKAALDALAPDQQQAMIEEAITAAQNQIDEIVPDEADAAQDEQAAISPPAKVVNGPGGSIPVREDGLMELNHYSGKRLDVIDPAMRGTGPMRGQEQARIGKKSLGDQPAGNIVDRSYFGVGDPFYMQKWLAEQAALPKKERADHPPRTAPYRNEGLGNARHTVAVDPATMYNWYEDPMGLRDQLDKTTPPLEQVTHYEKLIKDAGFKGAYYSEGDLGQTAILFDKAEPESVTNDIMGLDPKDIASIDDFKQLSPETFKKGGWSVITGIQEAQGEHNSPANIEANKKLENVLKANGIKYQVVSGAYKGVDQGKSFLIFASEKRARELGKRFNQESILTRDGLLYTDGRITPVDPAGTIIGPEAAKQDFYSTLPDGTPFTLGLDFDATYNPDEVAAQYGIDDVMGMREEPALTPLPGLPGGSIGPVDRVVSAAQDYAVAVGMPVRRQAEYVQVDKERAKRIADAYAAMEHAPNDPAVKAAYRAMIDETLAQYQFVKASGLKIEFIAEGQPDPYTEGPKQVLDDLKRGHLWVFPTDSGFGSEGDNVEGNPLLEPTNEYIGDRQLLANDVFRIVHDFFGHGIEGSGFGARGEENAWQSHMRLYSEAALPAVTSETRGQNSWVNFGPHGEANRANQKETVYAPQKTGIMPEWTWREGVASDNGIDDVMGMRAAGEDVTQTPEFKEWFGESRIVDENENPLVVYHGTNKTFRTFKVGGERARDAGFFGVGIYATPDVTTAEEYASSLREGEEDSSDQPVTMPLYYKVENPFVFDLTKEGFPATKRGLLKLGIKVEDKYDGYPSSFMLYSHQTQKFTDAAKAAGFDGAVVYMPNWQDGQGRDLDEVVAFDNTQIKSTENQGTFDGSDPDIYAMVAKPSRIDKLMDQVPGLKRVAKHMLPDERAKLYKGNASTIVNIFENLPDPSEIASVAFAGRAKKGWYQRSAEALVDIFGIEDAPRFTALLAALSPQTSVENNAITALKVWTAWNRANRPVHADAIKRILAANVQGQNAEKSVLGAWINNSVTSLSSPDPSTVVLSGPKVDSFMQNLRGVTNAVTNDAWMANYANIDQKVFAKSGEKAPGKGPGYVAFSARVRAAAALLSKRTGVEWTPAEIQETVWSWAKTLTEMAESKEETRSAVEIVEQSGLTAEQIAATPDFASLFAQGVYAAILKEGGYDVETAGSSGRSDVVDGGAGDPASAEGSGVSQSTHDTNIRRAAQRLDALLAKRAEARAIEAEAKRLGKGKKVKGESGNRLAPESESDLDFTPMDQPGDTDPLAHLSEDDLKFIDEGGLFGQRSAPGPLPDVDLLAAPTRAAYKGETKRPKKGVALTPDAEGINPREAGIGQIGQNFVKLLGLTARLGRFTLKGSNVMGQFSTKQAVVRLRNRKDLSTLVHEGGHALQASANKPLTDFINSHVQELHKAAAEMYEGDMSKMGGPEKVAEGFAEFFRVYTLGRAYAAKHYPTLTDDFTLVLEQAAPELKKGLEAIRTQFEAWTMLPSSKAVESMIVPGKIDRGIDAAIKEIREAGFGTWMHEVVRGAVETSVNRYAGMNELVNAVKNLAERNNGKALDVKRADDPSILVRLAGNAGARAMVQTIDGVMPYQSTEAVTRGLRAALALSQGYKAGANVGKIDQTRRSEFAAYVVALRGIDEFRRMAEGKIRKNPLGDEIELGDLHQTVKDLEAKYGAEFTEAAAIMHEYGMALWEKSYKAGLMSRDTYRAGLDRRFYVPLQRDMSDIQNAKPGEAKATGGRSIVKKFGGSARDVIDPMDVLMHKTFALEQAIAQNDVAKALAALADRAGQAGALVERVPVNQMVGKQYSVEEVAKMLTKDSNVNEDDAHDLMEILDQSIVEGNVINLFRSEQAKTKGENILFFWENGKVAAIQLMDGDVGADIVNLMNGVGPENFHFLIEMVSSVSGAFRSAITLWPDFLAVNFIRDQWNAYALTDVGYIPFVTGIRGVGDELRQRSWAKQYNAAMGIMGGMNVASLHNARVERDVNALRKQGYIAQAFNQNGFAGIAKGMASMVELTETGTRVGLFRKAFERGKKDGLTDWEASIEASYLATDYMDFGLNGSRMALFRRTIPFLNAQVQGLYKLVRTLGADEVRQRKGLAYVLKAYTKSVNNLELSRNEKQAINTGRKAWVKMASLALLSAALHFIFEDDPDYQEAGEYLRATGWVIPMGDGRIFYIPKPFELALLANFTERALESASGDAEAKNRFMRGLAMNLTPPTSPPAIKVMVELAANKDFFSGREIVPGYMQALAPILQYDNYTTDFAKQIGEATGMSPMKIDHVMSGLGASAYRDLSTMYNGLNPDRPDMDATDLPFTRRFVRDVRRGSTTAQDFWKQASTVDGLLRRAEATYKEYAETGNQQAADAFLRTLDEDQRAYALLNTHFKADAKKLNPFYRGRQVTGIVSALRRELVSSQGVEDTTTKTGEPIILTASAKAKVDEELSEYARREMRNTLIFMNAPGWEGRKPMDTQSTLDVIESLDPRVSEELQRRVKKAKVVPSEIVQEYWPEVKDRVLADGADAILIDILTIAKAMQ